MSGHRASFLGALALLLIANVVALAGISWNRSAEPEAKLVLTERELALSHDYDVEDTGRALRLVPRTVLGQDQWQYLERLDKVELGDLGFDVSLPVTAPGAVRVYAKVLPRKAFVVLELAGKAWQRQRAKQDEELAKLAQKVALGKVRREDLEARRCEAEQERRTRSRLFAIDAGPDPAALRRRYPQRDRYAVVGGAVGIEVCKPEGERLRLGGHISRLAVDEVHLPLRLRSRLDRLLRVADVEEARQRAASRGLPLAHPPCDCRATPLPSPRFQATVAFGRRYQPWIVDLQPLPSSPAASKQPH